MGEFVTLAAQVGIFFLFTPLSLLARYGGRAVDLRKADAERRATMRECGIDAVEWKSAGAVVLDDGGVLRMPDLPDAPGIRRLEFTAPHWNHSDVTITGAASLRSLSSERRPGWQFAHDDMKAHLTTGGIIRVSYIDRIDARAGVFELADRAARLQVVDLMRQEAQIQAARAA